MSPWSPGPTHWRRGAAGWLVAVTASECVQRYEDARAARSRHVAMTIRPPRRDDAVNRRSARVGDMRHHAAFEA
jgi:hypothetical protein